MKTCIFICPPEIKLNSLTTTGTHFSQCHCMFSVPVEPLPVDDCAKILYLVCSTKFTREMAASPDICQSADDTLSCFEKKRQLGPVESLHRGFEEAQQVLNSHCGGKQRTR